MSAGAITDDDATLVWQALFRMSHKALADKILLTLIEKDLVGAVCTAWKLGGPGAFQEMVLEAITPDMYAELVEFIALRRVIR